MPFEPGQTGNASGRGRKEKPWREAINRAIKRREEKDPQALERLADRLISFALSEVAQEALPALKELGDRIDGKPKQQTEIVSGEDADGNAIPATININLVRGAGA